MPQTEIRTAVPVLAASCSAVRVEPRLPALTEKTLSTVREIITGASSLLKAAGTLARATLAGLGNKKVLQEVVRPVLEPVLPHIRDLKTAGKIYQEPSQGARETARKLLFLASSRTAEEALRQGKLRSLGAHSAEGLVWIDGRVRKEHLAVLLGITRIPVIMVEEPLAKLIMQDAHRQDHRKSTNDMMARARRIAWIPRGRRIAKEVVKQCTVCRMRNKKMEEQLMERLPPQKLTLAPPFSFTAVDQFGPFQVKDPAKARRNFPWHITLYTCLGTKACALYATPGSSAAVFLQTHLKFTSTYGRPRELFSDHATGAVAGTTGVQWEEVRRAAGLAETKFTFTEKGCSFRNGSAERAIQSARRTLEHIVPCHRLLDFNEFESTLYQVADTLNSRPITVRASPDGEYFSISPNDILLGRAGRTEKNRLGRPTGVGSR